MADTGRVLGEIREQGEAAGRCAAVRIARFVDAGDWGEYVRGYLGGLMSVGSSYQFDEADGPDPEEADEES